MIDLNYQKHTGASSFKTTLKELCEVLRKFEASVTNLINTSGSLSGAQKTALLACIAAVDAVCSLVPLLPD